MQYKVRIGYRVIGRNMHEPDPKARPFEIANDWPVEAVVAISSDEKDRRSYRSNFIEYRFVAHVAKMPDLVGVAD